MGDQPRQPPALQDVEVHGVPRLLVVPLQVLPPEPQEQAHVHVQATQRHTRSQLASEP
jgi:hypothetical protein